MYVRQVVSLILISLVSTLCGASLSDSQEFPLRRPRLRVPENFYHFLDIEDTAKLAGNALAAAAQKLKDENVVPEEKEVRRTELINDYYKNEIIKACKAKREKLQKEIDKAKKVIEKAEELEKEAKTYELLKLQFDMEITQNFCPLLLDPKQRAAYDKRLEAGEKKDEYFTAVQEAINEAFMLAPDKKVILNQVIGELLADLIKEVPGPALTVFNHTMALRTISLLPVPYGPDVRYGIGFSGRFAFNAFEVPVTVYIIKDIYGATRVSISVELPKHYKLSDLIPSMTMLDTFTFAKGKFILANFQGIDREGFAFKKGFNYGAEVDLTGPLAALRTLKDTSKKLTALVFESKPIILEGVINPFEPAKTTFHIAVPLYIGVDLQKISYVPSFFSQVLKQITTDEFTITVKPFKKTHFRLEAQAGTRLVLGTQKDPLRLTVSGLLEPPSVAHKQGYLSVGAHLKNMLPFAWLAIDNASLYLDLEPELLASLVAQGYPLPFTGILVRGEIDLGTERDSKARLRVTGGFRGMSPEAAATVNKKVVHTEAHSLQAKAFVDAMAQERAKSTIPVVPLQVPAEILFDVRGENIQFAQLARYAAACAAQAGIIKKPIPLHAIPTLTLHTVWGYVAFADTRIGGKKYKAGIGLQAETEIWDRKAGFRIFMNDAFRLSGWGYLPHLNLIVKGKELFRLEGVARDKGPRLAFLFDPREPDQGTFVVNGTLIVPPLGLKQMVDFKWYRWWLVADFESNIAGLSVIFGVRMNLHAKAPEHALTVKEKKKKESEKIIEEIVREMSAQEKAIYESGEKWRQLSIKFGFKDDFAEFLNNALAPVLRALKDNALKTLNDLSFFIAQKQERNVRFLKAERLKTSEEIARLTADIARLDEACTHASGAALIKCRATIAARKALREVKQAYRSALVHAPLKLRERGTRAVQTLVDAKAVRTATERILEGAAKGIELLAAGIKVLRVKEVVGEYSYRDMMELRLPRLVRLALELSIGDIPYSFVLEDLQFDFKHPKQSCAAIVFTLMQAFAASQHEKQAKQLLTKVGAAA